MSDASLRTWNFSSGPACLPLEVLTRCQGALIDLDQTGIGILEHSHRSAAFGKVLARAESAIRRVAVVPDEYDVLFLSGSASMHFHMVPMNFLRPGTQANYVDTGVWSGRAIAEARRVGEVFVAATAAPDFRSIPNVPAWSPVPAYVHYTSNNTIYGTEWASEPNVPAGVPLICDASSDLFARRLDVTKYGMIYAGAQKNLGPSGLSLVIARRDLLAQANTELATLLAYQTFARDKSMYNTPNTFGIFVMAEVVEWIERQGGLAAMETHNRHKATLLYDSIDRSRHFRGHANREARSLTNVTFRGTSPEAETRLLQKASAARMSGLEGHRYVGGLRASIYNAFPVDGVVRLAQLIDEVDHELSPVS